MKVLKNLLKLFLGILFILVVGYIIFTIKKL